MKFYSQHKQDEYIFRNFFPEKRNGVFIDIGASDGIDLSNSYFFEKELGWSGICIEPQKFFFDDLHKNRACVCVEGCIADFNGEGIFLQIEGYARMLSGLVNKYDSRWLGIIDNAIKTNGGSKKEIEVNCYVLNDLLNKNNISNIDLCSIDVEGGELDILKTIDFNKFNFDVFTIENNYGGSEIKDFLEKKGFRFIERIMVDDIYKNTFNDKT